MDRRSAAADWIGAVANQIDRNQGNRDRSMRNRFKIRRFLAFLYLEGARLAPF